MAARRLVLLTLGALTAFGGSRRPGFSGEGARATADQIAAAGTIVEQVEPGGRDWESAAGCEDALRRRPASIPGRLRIASWNVRWFPDGTLEPQARGAGTDLTWLSCAIALLDAPVIAVQEFRSHAAAATGAARLLEHLDARTGGRWRLRLDHCPRGDSSHVGFLYDAARVEASRFRSIAGLSGGNACRAGLHPALAGYFRIGDFDATLLSVHSMWGFGADSLALRRAGRRALGDVVGGAVGAERDEDVIVLGDFNTNGARGPELELSAAREIEELRGAAALTEPGLGLLTADQRCTQYEPDGSTYLLDHALVSDTTAELVQPARARVDGLCASRRCAASGGPSRTSYYARLSDHCPISVELYDRDLD